MNHSNVTISPSPTCVISGTSASQSIYTLSATNGVSYSIGYGGGGGTHSAVSAASSTAYNYDIADVVLTRPGGKKIHLGKLLDSIMDMLCIIEPDQNLIDRYPALKEAYEEHRRAIDRFFGDDKIRETYNNYQTIKNLVSGEIDV